MFGSFLRCRTAVSPMNCYAVCSCHKMGHITCCYTRNNLSDVWLKHLLVVWLKHKVGPYYCSYKWSYNPHNESMVGLFSPPIPYLEVVAMLDVEGNFRFWLCIYPVVLLMRLFKSFAAQKRLAIVTDTFRVAYNDLMHFFVVFLSLISISGGGWVKEN